MTEMCIKSGEAATGCVCRAGSVYPIDPDAIIGRQTPHSTPVLLPLIFLLPFLPKKSHVNPKTPNY